MSTNLQEPEQVSGCETGVLEDEQKTSEGITRVPRPVVEENQACATLIQNVAANKPVKKPVKKKKDNTSSLPLRQSVWIEDKGSEQN